MVSKLGDHWTFVHTWMNVGMVINPQLAFGQVQLRVSLSLKYKNTQIPRPLCILFGNE